jgi:hypothetical protein
MMRWNVVTVPLERNPKDTRQESWKIQGSKDEWMKLASKIQRISKLSRDEQISLLEKLHKEYGVDCVDTLNERKISLGLIKPNSIEPRFEKRKNHDPSIQSALFQTEPFQTIKNYDIQPRLKYRCSGCRKENGHDQQVIEWGVYEWIRNNEEKLDQLWEALGIVSADYQKSFLVGNQAAYRNAFMIISVFRHKQPKVSPTALLQS